jgi:Na+/melibiose symporter-like transporter
MAFSVRPYDFTWLRIAFLSSSFVQRMADKFGRRPLMIILPLLATISTISLPLSYKWNNDVAMWIFIVATGVFVSASSKSIFVPTLCVADIADDDER